MMNGDSCVSLLVSPTMLQSAAFGRTADRSRIIPIAIPDAVPFGGNRTGRKTLRQKVYSMNLYGLLRKECDELISAWVTAAMVLNGIAWTMMSALLAMIFSVDCALRGTPKHGVANTSRSKGDWDIVPRIVLAIVLVFMISNNAMRFGPQLSGVLSTFPVYALLFSIFTHVRQGATQTANLLLSVVLGVIPYIGFFAAVGILLRALGIMMTYLLATIICIGISTVLYGLARSTMKY